MTMGKVRVLHLELDCHMGGIESFLFNLYNQIDKDKVQFDFVTRAEKPAMASELEKLGARICKVPSYHNLIEYMKKLDSIIENGYDVVHIHKNSAAIVLPFIVAHRHPKVRVFAHSHNTSPSIGGVTEVLHLINKGVLWKYSDEHFACSQVAGEWLYGTNRNYTVLKNGINTSDYQYEDKRRLIKRKKLGIGESTFVIGNVGRFTEQKNHKRLVQIFEEFLRAHNDSILMLVGDGEQRKAVEDYCKERNLIEHVRFLGVRKDVADLMMAMDAFMMPSIYEGLPIVAIEAQSVGLPLYLSDTISKETDITNSVQWFSLEEDNKSIVDKICIEQRTAQRRAEQNTKVRASGFDMKETADYLLRKYQGL